MTQLIFGILIVGLGLVIVYTSAYPQEPVKPAAVALPAPVVVGDLRKCYMLIIRNARFDVSQDYTTGPYYNAKSKITIYNPGEVEFSCTDKPETTILGQQPPADRGEEER